MGLPKSRRRLRWAFRAESSGQAESAARASGPTQIHVIAYGPDAFTERDVADPGELSAIVRSHAVTWVDVSGLQDVPVVTAVADAFGVHGLALEDVLHVHQRPKVEPYPGHLFVVMRMVETGESLDSEQVSLVLGPSFVVTFQEGRPGDCYGSVRDRVRRQASRLRTLGADSLFHALVDAMVDSAFPALEAIGERLEKLESEILDRATTSCMAEIQDVRRDLLVLRRIAFPSRDATAALYRDPNPLISDETRIYLRDCHDHAVQIMDFVETCRELASSLTELYLSSVSNRLNEVMKVLTIISTIFMPLSFIASIYGMNFDRSASPWNMPELGWRLGYPFALGLMLVVLLGLLAYFWRKGWLGEGRGG